MKQILSDWERTVLPIGLMMTIGYGGLVGYGIGYSYGKKYLNVDKVQVGYVIPNRLEIIVKDLDKQDGTGIPETYLKYDGKTYALTLDKQGNPRIQHYVLKPAEVKPAEVILDKPTDEDNDGRRQSK